MPHKSSPRLLLSSNEFEELMLEVMEKVLELDEVGKKILKKSVKQAYADAERELAAGSFNISVEIPYEATLAETGEAGKLLLETWKTGIDARLENDANTGNQVKEQLQPVWGNALNLLSLLISVSQETCRNFGETFNTKTDLESNFVFLALLYLYARGCQVCKEILLLLNNGFADGAYARWRTLHELAVISSFIRKHGNSTAEQFILHQYIENDKHLVLYQQLSKSLRAVPVAIEIEEKIANTRNDLIAKYGEPFKYDYGWAASALNKNRITFADIEKDTGFDYFRLLFKSSSGNIHVTSKSLIEKLKLYKEPVLSGPDIFGLALPAMNTAISMHTLTKNYLLLDVEDFENLAFMEALRELTTEIIRIFEKVENEVREKYGKEV